jgi:nucleoside-diphosphate-sugar epimerase
VALAALRAHHAWNVEGPVPPSQAERAEQIAEALGWRSRIMESEAEEAPGFNEDKPIVLSATRIREELAFGERHDTAQGLADNLRRYAEWRAAR